MLLFIHWNPDPDFLILGNTSIKWYGVMWALSILGSYGLGSWLLKRDGKSTDRLVLLVQYIFIGGLIGARMGQVLFYDLEYFAQHPLDIVLKIRQGGLASHGGLLGSVFAVWLFSRHHPEFPFLYLLDTGAIPALLCSSLIRFGNLMNSELVGYPTNVPWGFVFVQNGEDFARHPSVLYESLLYASLLLVFIILFANKRNRFPGFFLSLFFICVFTFRFLLEFLKEPDGGIYFHFITHTQVLNVPFIIGGLLMWWWFSRNTLVMKSEQ